jgi:hypothetical protein
MQRLRHIASYRGVIIVTISAIQAITHRIIPRAHRLFTNSITPIYHHTDPNERVCQVVADNRVRRDPTGVATRISE